MGDKKVNISKDVLDGMNEILEVQGSSGNWDYDEYMLGIYNGMEFMVAMVEDREPVFKKPPKQYLKDIPNVYTDAVFMRN